VISTEATFNISTFYLFSLNTTYQVVIFFLFLFFILLLFWFTTKLSLIVRAYGVALYSILLIYYCTFVIFLFFIFFLHLFIYFLCFTIVPLKGQIFVPRRLGRTAGWLVAIYFFFILFFCFVYYVFLSYT